MAELTDFFGSGGGGGLTPKFQEFNSSGTFTPSASLIAAGGYIEVFLVGGGGRSNGNYGATGGEVRSFKMYLTSVSNCAVTIGSGGNDNGVNGSDSVFAGSSAGGTDVTSLGGAANGQFGGRIGNGWGSMYNDSNAGPGVFGYGAGGGYGSLYGISSAKANSGQGVAYHRGAGSGYCLIKWYE